MKRTTLLAAAIALSLGAGAFADTETSDRAGGFGHLLVTTDTFSSVPGLTTTASTDELPILHVNPPTRIDLPVNRIIPPVQGGGDVSAAPLPPAAPAGLAMLGLLGLASLFRKARRLIA